VCGAGRPRAREAARTGPEDSARERSRTRSDDDSGNSPSPKPIGEKTETPLPHFGPFYPPFLQEEVNHAERLANLLRRVPVPGADDEASAWLIGRADEIECFVGEVTADWNTGRVRSIPAAVAIGTYVDGLHRNLARRLGVRTPRCCSSTLDVTAAPLSCASVTALAIIPPAIRMHDEWRSRSKTRLMPAKDRRRNGG
jgi:hypothetical protein